MTCKTTLVKSHQTIICIFQRNDSVKHLQNNLGDLFTRQIYLTFINCKFISCFHQM